MFQNNSVDLGVNCVPDKGKQEEYVNGKWENVKKNSFL